MEEIEREIIDCAFQDFDPDEINAEDILDEIFGYKYLFYRLDIVLNLEIKFEIEIPDEKALKWITVQDMIDTVVDCIKRRELKLFLRIYLIKIQKSRSTLACSSYCRLISKSNPECALCILLDII